jgi:tetratricopeptide (TPR) repeat protein
MTQLEKSRNTASAAAQRRLLTGGQHDNGGMDGTSEPDAAALGALQAQALAMAASGDCGPAASEVNERLVALCPDDAHAHARLARCREQAGDLELAAVHYRETLRLRPTLSVARRRLAAVERRQSDRRVAQVATTWRQAVSLGRRALGEGDHGLALQLFERAVALGGGEAAHRGAIKALVLAGQLADAEARCVAELNRGPRDRTMLLLQLAAIRRRQGRPQDAVRICTRLAATRQAPAILTVLAAALADQGRIGEAAVALRRLLAIAPDDKLALATAARIRAMSGPVGPRPGTSQSGADR